MLENSSKRRDHRLINKLIYLLHTRSDIAFAISVLNQHMHLPKEAHLEAVYKIFRYLKGSLGKGLLFKKCQRQWRYSWMLIRQPQSRIEDTLLDIVLLYRET